MAYNASPKASDPCGTGELTYTKWLRPACDRLWIRLLTGFATNFSISSAINYGVIAIEVGFPGTVYEATSERVPLVTSRLKDSMEAPEEGWFPTNKYFPLESLAITVGFVPVVNGEFVSKASVPSEPTEYAARFEED